jgi:hypothetical protein
MRKLCAVLLCCTLMACGGDKTPLPPLNVGPQWMPLSLDTTGNMMLRRMAVWIDTAHVTTSAAGFALTSQKTQMDMKIGGMSTGMQLRTEIDCNGKRFRVLGMDSMTVTMKGVAVPDSIAKQAAAQQSGKMTDTTWRAVGAGDRENTAMLTAVCAKLTPPMAKP